MAEEKDKNPNPGEQNPDQEKDKNLNPDEQNPDQEKGKKTDKQSALIASYKKGYPKEKAFHVTSDYQVFLEKDLAMAKIHQKTVDANKEVQTIKA